MTAGVRRCLLSRGSQVRVLPGALRTPLETTGNCLHRRRFPIVCRRRCRSARSPSPRAGDQGSARRSTRARSRPVDHRRTGDSGSLLLADPDDQQRERVRLGHASFLYLPSRGFGGRHGTSFSSRLPRPYRPLPISQQSSQKPSDGYRPRGAWFCDMAAAAKLPQGSGYPTRSKCAYCSATTTRAATNRRGPLGRVALEARTVTLDAIQQALAAQPGRDVAARLILGPRCIEHAHRLQAAVPGVQVADEHSSCRQPRTCVSMGAGVARVESAVNY
jgi:hypothetical protein